MFKGQTTVTTRLLAAAFTIALAATAPALAQPKFSVFGSLTQTEELEEALGAGLRVGFPINETLDFDISVSYYEDFEDRFGDEGDEGLELELSYIPADFGLTWTRNGDNGLQAGLGLTWAYLDINGLEIEGQDLQITGEADNEFGGYIKLGYKTRGGFWVESMYRLPTLIMKNSSALDEVMAKNFIRSMSDLFSFFA